MSWYPLWLQDRLPWLQSLHEVLARWVERGTAGVLACSALRKSYRDVLMGRGCSSGDISMVCKFVLLEGPEEVVRERLEGRTGHFMPVELLASQLATLEVPGEDEQCVRRDVRVSIEEIVRSTLEELRTHQIHGPTPDT